MRKSIRLWQWVGWRMGLIAACAVTLISFFMWVRFLWWDMETLSRIPEPAKSKIELLLEDPLNHQKELWYYLSKYYSVDDVLPGITGSDWWTICILLIISMPVIFTAGFLLLRPMSRKFVEVAKAARKVAQGNLDVELETVENIPLELNRLCKDFNSMTHRLRQYEQEVRESSAVVAHELRTPLNAAMGRVRGMLDEVFPTNQEQLGLVLHQLENINLLVNDLHLLSLAQAGQLHLSKESFDLPSLVGERIKWFKPHFDDVGRNVHFSPATDLPVEGDRNRLGQVINILMDNYLRYATAGGDLEIISGYTASDVFVTFQDQGPGLTSEEIDRVFQRFWRQESSRTRRSGGSGLGLSIAQAICHAHEGRIEARHHEGGGMKFTITLPSLRKGSSHNLK